MKLDASGLAFIESNEGCRLDTYFDERDPPVLTLGIGHVVKPNEPWWNGGQPSGNPVITREQADAMFLNELRMYESAVNAHVQVPLGQGQYTALVDFAYNEGVGGLIGSTLLRVLNMGLYVEAAAHFAEWNKVMKRGIKVVSAGLTKRRAKETALFLRDVPPDDVV